MKNYFKTAWRRLGRRKVSSLLNIVGLSIAISSCLIIFLVVSYDMSFDKFEKARERIYRIVSSIKFPDNDFKNAGIPVPLAKILQKELSGLELFVPLSLPQGKVDVSITSTLGAKPLHFQNQNWLAFVDSSYFRMLSYHWIAGSAEKSLLHPFTTVLTESRARFYFPGIDLSEDIGKIITYNDSINATVTGIVKDLTENSDFKFKEFISYSTIENSGLKFNMHWDDWRIPNFYNQFFIQIKKDANPQLLSKQIQQISDKIRKDAFPSIIYSLQPLSDLHFNKDYESFNDRIAHRPTLYALIGVALILLLLGCVNFINLSTANGAKRGKEIGIRKTLGASKKQLILQFIFENFHLTCIATIVSLLLTPLIISLFSNFIPSEINIWMLFHWETIFFVVLLTFFVAVFAGFYPSLVLSRYKPVRVLKGDFWEHSPIAGHLFIRKSLSVVQLTFAQAFIITTIMVSLQLHYSLNKDLGFRKDGIITVKTPLNPYHSSVLPKGTNARGVLLGKIRALPGIQASCTAGDAPATTDPVYSNLEFSNDKKQVTLTAQLINADESYFKLYNIPLIAGRYSTKGDSIVDYMVNETFARVCGFFQPFDIVGKTIRRGASLIPIIGVVKDFHSESLHEPIKPIAFYSDVNWQGDLQIALKSQSSSGTWSKTIAQIKTAFNEIYPGEEFTYKFLDNTIARFYADDSHAATLLSWATGLAIAISSLGLLGLVIVSTSQRTKEIGIRKVLGASVIQIIVLLSAEFIKAILLAFMIASPIAWIGLNKWLQGYAYHLQMSIWIFIISCISMILVAFLTVIAQTLKAANAPPTTALRLE